MARVRVRFGFTLIELLVVIAIIAVLIGLLVPAVQKVRQAANKISCGNNLHQIAIAAANYESANGYLPPGAAYGNGSGSFLGTLPYLLPYVEQDPVFKQFPSQYFDITWNGGASWGNSAIFAASQTNVKTFMCPSDNPFSPTSYGTFVAYLTLYGSYTLQGWYWGNPAPPFGKSNYIACGGAIGAQPDTFWGPMCGVYYDNSRCKSGAIPDGTSNTVGFGECLGGTNKLPRDWNLSWIGSGSMASAWDLTDPCQWYTFGGYHTAGVQFAMCDGSVKTLTRVGSSTPWYGTQWYNLQYATGMQEGQVITWSVIEP